MALIKVSDCFLDNDEMFDTLIESFDSIERIEQDNWRKVSTFRVLNDEIPKEDILICPSYYRFEGVRPFVIEWM